MSRFVRNSLLGTIAGISTTLGNFVSSLVVARLLGVDQAGLVAFAVWIIFFGTTIIEAGVPFTLARYMPEVAARDGDAQARSLAALLFRPFVVAALLPAVGFTLYAAWLRLQSGGFGITAQPLTDPVLCLLIGLNTTTLALGDYARSFLRGTHNFGRVAKVTTTSALLQIAGLCVGSYMFGPRGAMAAYLAASLAPLIVLRDLRGHRRPVPKEIMRRVARYTRFRWASDLLGFFIWSRVEILFLQLTWGVKAVGLFTVGMTLSNLAVQGPLMLTWALMPQFSEQHGRKDRESMRQLYGTATRLLAFLVFPACFGLAAILPTLLPLLYGAAFVGAIPAAQILVCAASISAVSAVGANLVWALERSDVDFYAGLVGASLSVLGGLLIIAPFGEIGAAVSRGMTQLAAVTIASWFLTQRLGFAIPVGALMRLLVAAALCGIAAHVTLALRDGLPGLVLAIAAGAASYLVAVRVVGGLQPEDIIRLRSALRALPLPIARTAEPLAQFILG